LFGQAASYVPAGRRDERLGYLDRQADALSRQGDERGANDALRSAIEIDRQALQERTRERDPLDWAKTQNKLGFALWTLGQRESGTARLEQAIAAWDACLTVTVSVWPSERVQFVRARREDAQLEIKQRSAK